MASAFKRVAGYLGLMDEEELDHGNNQLTERAPRLVRANSKSAAKSNVELLPASAQSKIMDHIISLTPRTFQLVLKIRIQQHKQVFLIKAKNL